MAGPPFGKPRWPRAYAFGLVTGALFLISWLLQLVFQYQVVRNDAAAHGQPFTWSEFWPQFLASTFENWQSEFLQLVWQAAGLALFYFWGSSQSRESGERVEAQLAQIRASARQAEITLSEVAARLRAGPL